MKFLVEKLSSNWRQFSETADKEYNQKQYIAHVLLSLNKHSGNSLTNAVIEIRSIPGVTTVTKEQDRASTEAFEQNLYSIKFAIGLDESPQTYVARELLPELKRIEGITVDWFKGYEEIG